MNILLLCKRHYTGHDILRERFGRLYHFPRQWANCGHHVTLIAADYRGLRTEVAQEPGLTMIASPLLLPWKGFTQQISKAVKQRSPDLVIASCDSHFGYIGYRLAKRLKVPFVFDLYHNYEDFGTNRLPGMKRLYGKGLNNAKLVVCDSEALAKKVASRSRAIHIAAQATDAKIFRPLDRESCRKALGLDTSNKILAYVGNIDSRFDRDTVMGMLAALTEIGLNSTLLVAGPGLDRKTMGSPHVHHLGKLPQKDVPMVIGSADLCLIPYARTALAETCNPCKLSEYIACNRPIVASNISNISRYLPKSGHLCYEPGNVESLLRSVSTQLTTPIIEERKDALLWENVGTTYLQELEKLSTNQRLA